MVDLSFDEVLKKGLDFFEKGEYSEMLKYVQEAVERNPYHLTANYLLAVAYSNVGRWMDTYSRLCYLERLQGIYEEELIEGTELAAMKEQAEEKCLSHSRENMDLYVIEQQLREIKERYERLEQNYFVSLRVIDEYFRKSSFFGQEYYLGRYLSWSASHKNITNEGSSLTEKMDIYPVEAITKKRNFTENVPCVVPVVANCEDGKISNSLHVQTEKGNYCIDVYGYKKYDYFRIDEPTTIMADNMMVVGKPIPLRHDSKRKKLVLSIFLDSFSWKVVKEKSMQECMPNSFEFFKDGLVCDEYYVGSEFTYPSTATYWTGLRSTHHKMLNVNVQNAIPDNVVTFPEIFQENGYFTAKIGGNDGLIPDTGYIRGIDRFLYQYYQENFMAEQAVHQAIEHIEAFKETDQYIWLDIPDLHDVSGGWDMPLSVQTSCPMRVNEIDFKGGKYPGTLYFSPSPNRKTVYMKELEYIDRQLGVLFRYIKDNYKRDEVVVTLFSDHGNGFNVDENQPFLSWQRENVPLMIYGADFPEDASHELIESVDYGKILCHLAGITDERLDKNDGQLPSFLGGKKKEYVFAQSLHPEREYCAFVGTEQYRFYLESDKLVDKDCRINISAGVKVLLRDMDDRDIKDAAIINRCKEIVLESIKDFAY